MTCCRIYVSVSDCRHGDDDPVEAGGNVREATVGTFLNVVAGGGEHEARDDQEENEEAQFSVAGHEGVDNALK